MHELFRMLPKVDDCLRQPSFTRLTDQYYREEVTDALRACLQRMREAITKGELTSANIEGVIAQLPARVEDWLLSSRQTHLRKVINATGVPLHTNLGRAPLASEAIDAVVRVAQGYSNLEYDLENGVRGSRHDHVRHLLRKVTGAEDGIVVNNNAGAVLLVLSALAKHREVVVSRGQLVEVGGSFRIPDVMEQGGALLREVGTTNKTHARDYLNATTDDTVAYLKVHTSNFRVMGFTSEVSTAEMVELAHARGLLALEDLGSGVLISGLGEPTVQEVVQTGMDVVTFSGDKLLGGPQAGIIVGKADLIDKVRSHPLARALRVDKMTLAALEATLGLYVHPEHARERVPLLRVLSLSLAQLQERADALASKIQATGMVNTEVIPCTAPVGGGSLPTDEFPGYGIVLHSDISCVEIEERMRKASVPIVGRILDHKFLIDPRTVPEEEWDQLLSSLQEVLSR